MLCEKCGEALAVSGSLCQTCQDSLSDNQSAQFYTHSGKIDFKVLGGIPAITIVSVVLSFIYSYSVVYIPIVGYFNIILTLCFSAAMAVVTGQILRFFTVRNSTFSFCFGLLSGLIALYFSWVTFEYVLINRYSEEGLELMPLAKDPSAVWEIACSIAKEGWYSLGGTTPTGIVLWIFWGIEACIIVGACALISLGTIDSAVFCERCRKWADDVDAILNFKTTDPQGMIEKLSSADFSFLQNVEPVLGADPLYFKFDGHCCGSCDDLFTVNLTQVSRSWDKDGKEDSSDDILLQHLLIDKNTFDELCRFSFVKSAVHVDDYANRGTDGISAENTTEEV